VTGRERSAAADIAVAGLALLAIAVALEVWTTAFRVPSYLMPAPSAVIVRLVRDAPVFASETLVTASPASASARAVPPVETSSKPRAARPRPTSTIPVLSETLSKALGIGMKVQYYLP